MAAQMRAWDWAGARTSDADGPYCRLLRVHPTTLMRCCLVADAAGTAAGEYLDAGVRPGVAPPLYPRLTSAASPGTRRSGTVRVVDTNRNGPPLSA